MENEIEIKDLPEDIQKYIKSLRSEAAENRVKLKDFTSLQEKENADKEAQRTKELEEAKKKEQELEQELLKKSEYQKLYEAQKNKLSELEMIKSKYDSIQLEIEKERLELIKKLPNEKREIYKDLNINVIKDVLDTLDKSKLDVSVAGTNNVSVNGEIDFTKLSPEQIQVAIEANPSLQENYERYVMGSYSNLKMK